MLVLKIYKEVKPHYSEEGKDKVVQGESDKYDNYEYLYYFLMEKAPARS